MAALVNTRDKPPPDTANTQAKPPPEVAKKNDKPEIVRLLRASKVNDGKTVSTTVRLTKSRHFKPPRKAEQGWEKTYSDDESANDDEGISVITHHHVDTQN
jgi:hypothetical protein